MDRNKYVNYTTSIMALNNTQSWGAECNDLVMWNQGTQNVMINGIMLLSPGMSFTFAGYPGEMNVQGYDIVFDNDQQAGCNLVIIMKQYLDGTLKKETK